MKAYGSGFPCILISPEAFLALKVSPDSLILWTSIAFIKLFTFSFLF